MLAGTGESRAELTARIARGKFEAPPSSRRSIASLRRSCEAAEREGRLAQVSPYWLRMEPAMERWLTRAQQRAERRTYGFPDGDGDGEDGGAH
jgi:hypothetical protein